MGEVAKSDGRKKGMEMNWDHDSWCETHIESIKLKKKSKPLQNYHDVMLLTYVLIIPNFSF